MAARTTDIREWAKAEGINLGGKGPIPAEIREQYAAAHAPPADPEDYPGEQGPPVILATAPPEVPPADNRQAERAPARPRGAPVPRGRGISGLFSRKPAPAAGKGKSATRKLPRVSIANLIEDAWSQMAFAASPIPPMQRLLQAQSAFAGIALEDALAGTVVDRALQPIARAEDKAKAVGGLMFPPMALMMVLATAPVPQLAEGTDPQDQQYLFPEPTTQHKAALMTLRWSLMLWSEAGAARLDQYKARAEENAQRGAAADQFMAWILGMEPPPGVDGQAADPEAAAVSAEDEAVRRAQQMFGG